MKFIASIFIPLLKYPASFVALKLASFALIVLTATLYIGFPIQDPWFDAFTLFYIFSAITAGMPEPEPTSSFGYIWMYRSCHILSANGTAYFIHRDKWNDISGEK